jgi:endothelin-converting enzyme/putative endopeptidase
MARGGAARASWHAMNMAIWSILAVAAAACGSHLEVPRSGPAGAQHGIYTEDLDRSADACRDFYEYANGGWRQHNPIPASMQRWSRRWQAGETAKDRLKDILEEVSARKDWPASSVEQLIGDFYGGCMDQARIDQRGAEPIKPLLAEIEQIHEPADVGRMITQFHVRGIQPPNDQALAPGVPFGLLGTSDLHEPSHVIAWITASGLSLPNRDYYVKPEPRFAEARERFVAHVAATFELAGRDAATARRAADAVLAIELGFAKASLDNVALRDPAATDHLMTAADVQKLTPRFEWAAVFRATEIQPTQLNVTEPAFLAEFERQLETTPIADWKAYFAWHLLNVAAPALSQPFSDASFAFFGKYLQGTQENKPRWKRCVEATDQLLGEALGKKYTDKYFPPAAKARMQQLVANLLAAMHDTIEKLAWMSAATKQRAIEKLATFNPKIGYPDRWKDYSSVAIRRDQFWESDVAARQWNVRDNLQTIDKPLDRGRWLLTPPTSDAYYNPPLNEIVFPAGILQPPAFSIDATDAVNYGAIGVVIGHEISHGFDDQGAQFDAQGRLDNWWSSADLDEFHARGQCVVNQFEHYFIEPTIHHTGKLVLGESIGDLGGVNLAYRAFQKVQQQSPAPTIDGLTPDQQFFLAWGQFRGDAVRPEFQRLMVQNDPHPIGKFRVIGPLSNMPEFQAAFSCKADAPMVRPPAERCSVW